MRVLIVEDHADIAANLCEFLEGRGATVDVAGDGVTGLHLAVVNDYDVLVLDLMLPGMDGLDLCQQLRAGAGKATPVLMLTARDTLDDKLAGFEHGADDYLVKPFALPELGARLSALVRRGKNIENGVLRVADLKFDPATLQVARAGQPLKLTRAGLRLLEFLMRNTQRVVAREELEHTLWGDDPPDSDALRSHIHQLRNVLDRPFPVPLLHTVHGIGYRLARKDVL